MTNNFVKKIFKDKKATFEDIVKIVITILIGGSFLAAVVFMIKRFS